jgi:hypothetical protein
MEVVDGLVAGQRPPAPPPVWVEQVHQAGASPRPGGRGHHGPPSR